MKTKFIPLNALLWVLQYIHLNMSFNSLIQNDKMADQYVSQKTLLDILNLNDGIDIKWSHAVNSKEKLSNSLTDNTVTMLEADVILGSNNEPIMAHSPSDFSDISLSEWLIEVFNLGKKGIKLDFKQTEAIVPSLNILKTIMKFNTNIPVILNADILEGPNNVLTKPVDANIFIEKCMQINNAILSPGWTSAFNGSLSEGYSWSHVQQMFKLINNTGLHVTFPVRASLVNRSMKQLLWLLGQNKSFTLTVWTSVSDIFDLNELLFLRKYKSLVYFDMPNDEINLIKNQSNSI
ncbi:protein FAM151B isoform X4 [Hydra vulgaris]|uniref:Protein FAM151B isoform X4 n=1 Tax=Hydra vulgaris TaxID=6087 RepID=A0ABM4BM75_HYDVU